MNRAWFEKIFSKWNQFWFSPVPLLNLALFRVTLTGTLFILYLSRHLDLALFYSDKGILPKEIASTVMPEFYRPPINLAFWSDSWLPYVHGLLLVGLLALTLGVGSRAASTLIGLGVIYINEAFLQRNMSVMFGADQIGGIFLLYLITTNHSQVFSLRSWLKSKKLLSSALSQDLWTPMFYRLIQVHLCIIYVYTGFEKLKGASWWDGTALWSVFANPQFVIVDMTWTRHFPLLIAAISFGTILFEIYFPVLVWFKNLRNKFLLAGVCFHSGIGILMALYSFALIMMAPYLLFIPVETLLSALRPRNVSK